ncbi:AAA family ATPase [Actinoplanes sp. NPDC049548]|uniref:helix-turn-helix transcriptional regulator n=1 Tax=Actinoplanes sp. NPDC049548 TaxID=3155152 RepID=UPI00343600A2
MVGRDEQIDRVEQALRKANSGHGGALFLVGEAGIGKTRLAMLAAEKAAELGMRVLRGRGSTIGPMVPFRPLTEALLSLFRGRSLPEDSALTPYRPMLGRLVPEWGQPHAQHGDSLVVLAEAVLRLLAVEGRDGGCLLVLDDLQDADAETLAVVEYLVDNVEYQPILVVATIREEPSAALDLAHSANRRHTGDILHLTPLGRAEVAALVAACLAVEPDAVPPSVADRLFADSAGNPFFIEELLHALVSSGMLARGVHGWRVVGELRVEVPAALVRGIAHRTDRLRPQGRALLAVGAILGHRFPLSVVQQVVGIDDRTLLAQLQAGIAAQLIMPDEPGPDWYTFRHPLTAEALLAQLTPSDRAQLSGRAADAVEELHPGLPGQWCALVAALRLAAGDPERATLLLVDAGRRALAAGAASSAVALLDRARELSIGGGDVEVRADVLESLLPALAETGAFKRALELVDALDELGGAGLGALRRAALHTQLAKVAHSAGRWSDGLTQIQKARMLLGPDAADEHTAPVDTVAAFLTLDSPSPGRTRIATDLARRAVVAAERVPLPLVACQAWQLLGTLARGHDLDESNECFSRANLVAEEHQLPILRIYALLRLAGNHCLADGDTTGLERVRQEAYRLGAVTVVYTVDAILAMQTVLFGDYATAGQQVADAERAVTKLHLVSILRYVLLARATLAAHQANRPEMERALAEFDRWDGAHSPELPLAIGLARVFCALLEEDAEQVRLELAHAAVVEKENPSTFHLAGPHGLYLLLDVLAGRADWPQFNEVAGAAASRMRWNRHFVELARAVLLGRACRIAEAEAAAAAAREAGECFPTAYHLGLRLVAEEADAHRWGDAEAWLRGAEEYFYRAAVAPAASACRALLRQIGASVRQRRTGADLVPGGLRALGVTVREYEVFQVLAERIPNKTIATRLHISPRTVEKHVASLLVKTSQPSRTALTEYAVRTLR